MAVDRDDPDLRKAAEVCANIVYDYMTWAESIDLQSNSQIAMDNRLFSVMSESEIVESSFKASLDCLALVTTTLNRTGYPRAHGHAAATRSAITAATTALWIMTDDVNVRRERALKIAYAQASAELNHVRDSHPDWLPRNDEFGRAVQYLATRCERICDDGAALGIERSTIRSKPKDQTIVRQGAGLLPKWALPTSNPGAYVLSEWRVLSALAHGFPWPIKYSALLTASSTGPGSNRVKIEMTLDQALGKVRNTLIVVRVAMDRWAVFTGNQPLDAHEYPINPHTHFERARLNRADGT